MKNQTSFVERSPIRCTRQPCECALGKECALARSANASSALLPVFRQQVIDTQTRLTNWHQDATKRLNIDIDETRRKRDGFDRVIHFFPGLIRNELNFRTIDKSVANIIDEQSYGNGSSFKYEQSELYLEDVQLIAKDGKVYYLPESKVD